MFNLLNHIVCGTVVFFDIANQTLSGQIKNVRYDNSHEPSYYIETINEHGSICGVWRNEKHILKKELEYGDVEIDCNIDDLVYIKITDNNILFGSITSIDINCGTISYYVVTVSDNQEINSKWYRRSEFATSSDFENLAAESNAD